MCCPASNEWFSPFRFVPSLAAGIVLSSINIANCESFWETQKYLNLSLANSLQRERGSWDSSLTFWIPLQWIWRSKVIWRDSRESDVNRLHSQNMFGRSFRHIQMIWRPNGHISTQIEIYAENFLGKRMDTNHGVRVKWPVEKSN
jgi:hypothetical protein